MLPAPPLGSGLAVAAGAAGVKLAETKLAGTELVGTGFAGTELARTEVAETEGLRETPAPAHRSFANFSTSVINNDQSAPISHNIRG